MNSSSAHVKALDHVVLTVADIDATLAFYTTHLGMIHEVFDTPTEKRHALRFGDQKINLHQSGAEFEPKAQNVKPGSADLCFVTNDVIDAVLSKLLSSGMKILEGGQVVQRTGARGTLRSIYLRDPDGNLIDQDLMASGSGKSQDATRFLSDPGLKKLTPITSPEAAPKQEQPIAPRTPPAVGQSLPPDPPLRPLTQIRPTIRSSEDTQRTQQARPADPPLRPLTTIHPVDKGVKNKLTSEAEPPPYQEHDSLPESSKQGQSSANGPSNAQSATAMSTNTSLNTLVKSLNTLHEAIVEPSEEDVPRLKAEAAVFRRQWAEADVFHRHEPPQSDETPRRVWQASQRELFNGVFQFSDSQHGSPKRDSNIGFQKLAITNRVDNASRQAKERDMSKKVVALATSIVGKKPRESPRPPTVPNTDGAGDKEDSKAADNLEDDLKAGEEDEEDLETAEWAKENVDPAQKQSKNARNKAARRKKKRENQPAANNVIAPEPAPTPEPKPVEEPKPEPQPVSSPDRTPEVEPDPAPKYRPLPELDPEVKSVLDHKPEVEPDPATNQVSVPEPDLAPEQESKLKVELVSGDPDLNKNAPNEDGLKQPEPKKLGPKRPESKEPTPKKPEPKEPEPEEPEPKELEPKELKPEEPEPKEPEPKEPEPKEPEPKEPEPKEPEPKEPEPKEPEPKEPEPKGPEPKKPEPKRPRSGRSSSDKLQTENARPDRPRPDSPKLNEQAVRTPNPEKAKQEIYDTVKPVQHRSDLVKPKATVSYASVLKTQNVGFAEELNDQGIAQDPFSSRSNDDLDAHFDNELGWEVAKRRDRKGKNRSVVTTQEEDTLPHVIATAVQDQKFLKKQQEAIDLANKRKAEQDRKRQHEQERERQEIERQERERQEIERLERERQESERLERERLERERLERERLERERLERERQKRKWKQREKRERERTRERQERERQESEPQESERQESERQEYERQERDTQERERQESERQESERRHMQEHIKLLGRELNQSRTQEQILMRELEHTHQRVQELEQECMRKDSKSRIQEHTIQRMQEYYEELGRKFKEEVEEARTTRYLPQTLDELSAITAPHRIRWDSTQSDSLEQSKSKTPRDRKKSDPTKQSEPKIRLPRNGPYSSEQAQPAQPAAPPKPADLSLLVNYASEPAGHSSDMMGNERVLCDHRECSNSVRTRKRVIITCLHCGMRCFQYYCGDECTTADWCYHRDRYCGRDKDMETLTGNWRL
ncbi:MAG: hypothetical protein M1828_005619 [Chrysothrix sp. TS-e1954]|nr:MAG: hypothetical protein M1828_005619 [Chrysothrix sp. TS-e1954]